MNEYDAPKYDDTSITQTKKIILNIYIQNMKNYTEADMRIVASTASMLEEPYWRIEEPNLFMAE